MASPLDPIDALKSYLQLLPRTLYIEKDEKIWSQLLPLLEEAWDDLGGSGIEKTLSDKLYRAEKVDWNSQELTFTLERHGSNVVGASTRADLHHWIVNIKAGIAAIQGRGHRQLSLMDKQLDVEALAFELRNKIVAGKEHEFLDWKSNTHVVLHIGKIIPETNAQTTASRRKRFRAALDEEMINAGWKFSYVGNKVGYKLIAPLP